MKKVSNERIVYGLIVALFSFLMLSMLVSCSDNDAPGTARLMVHLTDAPGDYEEVNIDIQGLQVKLDDDNDEDDDDDHGDRDDDKDSTGVNNHGSKGHGEEGEEGGDDDDGDDDHGDWITLDIHKGVYDLKQLTNGIDTLLGSAELPTGRIEQVRLILGPNNTVKVDGQVYPLKVPSGEESGLKVKVKEELREGITYKILLDFDAALSVVKRGNGTYILKPVIRAITKAMDGAIEGTIHPVEANASVFAIVGTDTVSTSTDAATGAFMVRGLTAGTYRVVFVPGGAFQQKEIADVAVKDGEVTSVGVVELTAL